MSLINQSACYRKAVLPYFVMRAKQAGCVISPVLDVSVESAKLAMENLKDALLSVDFAAVPERPPCAAPL